MVGASRFLLPIILNLTNTLLHFSHYVFHQIENLVFLKRLKIWLDREARKASEKANKKDERKDEQADQSKLRVHLLKFFEKYNDYEDDAQFYRGQEWARRKKNRRKEEEYDRNDRRKEEEEIKKNLDINGKRKRDDKIEYEQKKDDIQQRNKYCENVCEETTDNIENEAVTSDLESQKKDTEIDGNNEKTSRKTDEERELKNKVREKLLQNKLAEENNLTKCEEEDDSSLKTSDSEPNQIYEQNFLTQTEQIHHMKPNTNAQSGTNGDLKPLKVLKKKQKGVSKSSNLNKNGKSSLTKKGKQKQQNTSGRTADTTISDLERLTHSNPNQRDNAEFKAVEAANYTKNSSNEEEKEDASSRQFNGGKEEKQNYKSEKQNKKEYIDSLIAEIPQDKLTLFAYRIRWDLVDQTLLKRRVVGWIGRKLEQYTGKQNEMVVDYICSKLLLHSSADVVMSLLSNVLMEKTEAFVVKLWKLMIYEVKYKEFCTENKE